MIRSTIRMLVVALGLGMATAADAQDAAPPANPAPAAEQPAAAPAPDQASPPESVSPPPAASPAPIQVQNLGALDLFSTGRDTGLGDDVWKGSSADIAREVLPSLAAKPLSPAGEGLARRLLAQASTAPEGAGTDLGLAVARARELLALGDADDASLVLDRTPGVADHADLSQLAAEAALISDQDDKACRVADNLAEGRDGLYWLRLRAFCQARAGKPDEAQLTLNLVGAQGKDPVIARLLGVFVAGAGDPGPASLRNGLDLAVSRALKLDLGAATATASPPISRYWMLKNPPPTAAPDASAGPGQDAIADAISAVTTGAAVAPVLERLVDQAAREAAPRARARLQQTAAILASFDGDMNGAARAQFADFDIGRSETPSARLIALTLAAGAGLKGETALLSLQIAQSGGAAGPNTVDRCWIIRALNRVGLKIDAQAFALEGLTARRDTR